VATTERWFDSADELVLLELDPELLGADVAWPEVYPGQRFPHLSGALVNDAIVAHHTWAPADRRRWAANEPNPR
jgi:uncharacterized protein (DUF952 family)